MERYVSANVARVRRQLANGIARGHDVQLHLHPQWENATRGDKEPWQVDMKRWVVRQQQADGSWFYYADQEPGNFIDCFHSCFVVKNLLKVKRLVPEVDEIAMSAIERERAYIRDELYDGKCGDFDRRADPRLPAEAIKRLMDPGLRNQMGTEGKQ